jgi:inorganic pyrophosphatase
MGVILAAAMDASTALHCMIEIPKGSRNKYEWDADLQAIKLNRFLFSSVVFPTDYGFVTDTLGEKGEALDALVCVNAPTFPGCLIEVRAVGVLEMDDEEGRSDKLVCVPADDPAWDEVEGVEGLPEQLRSEIQHFYSMYKQPEGKEVQIHGWADREAAEAAVNEGRRRYTEAHP